jgi:hypothetical protein
LIGKSHDAGGECWACTDFVERDVASLRELVVIRLFCRNAEFAVARGKFFLRSANRSDSA